MRTEREPAPTPFNPEFKLHREIVEFVELGLTKKEAEDIINLRRIIDQGGKLSKSEIERVDIYREKLEKKE
jgi:hypothetical protein